MVSGFRGLVWMNINKSKLSREISDELDMSKEDSRIFINTFFSIKKKFLQNHNLKINKFGSFVKKTSPRRVGRNPKTLEEFVIPKQTKVSFKASKIIKKIIN